MEDRNFYVYAHYRLDTMEPFYIGKGKDERKDILSRNHIHDSISKKHGHAVAVLYSNLTEEEAFFYEREVIEDLVFDEGYEIPCKNCGEFTKKFSYLTNFTFGGEGSVGHNCSEESKKKISKTQKNRWQDPEARKKQSEMQKKRLKDPKVRQIQSEKVSGELNYHAKNVYCKELNIIFSYIKLAEEYCINVLNIKMGQVSRVCNGKAKSAGKLVNGTKLTWKYTENVDKEILDKAEYINSKRYEEIINANKKIS